MFMSIATTHLLYYGANSSASKGKRNALSKRAYVQVPAIQTSFFSVFQVSGLNSGRGLKMTISAVNANGKSESATLEGFTLKVAELQLGETFKLQLKFRPQ